ncbi:MAG: glycosyltransferase family 39 protein [Nanoarchaeota archaeon]
MIPIIFFLIICISAFYIGYKLQRLWKVRFKYAQEHLIFSLAIGFIILSFIVFFLGIIGLLERFIVYLLLVIILTLFILEIKSIYSYYRATYTEKSIIHKSLINKLIIIVLLIFIIINFISSFAPAIEWDSITYHLSLPKIFIQQKTIIYIPTILYSLYPLFTEMLFLIGMFANETVPQLLSFLFSLMIIAVIYNFSKRYFGREIGLISSLIFYTMPIISERTSQTMVEIPYTFYSFLAIYSIFLWIDGKDIKNLILSGIMAGTSASIKQTGFVIILICSLFVIYQHFRKGGIVNHKSFSPRNFCVFLYLRVLRGDARGSAYEHLQQESPKKTFLVGDNIIKDISIFWMISFLFGTPWYIRSFLYTGNPFYGLLYNIFGGLNWNHQLDYYFKQSMADGMGVNLLSYILLPWNLSFHSENFSIPIGITPIFFAFIPLLIFIRKDNTINRLLFISWIFTTSWFITSQQIRLLMPIFPLLAIVSGFVVYTITEKKKQLTILVTTILSFTILFNLGISMGINDDKIEYVLGIIQPEQFFDNLKDFNPHNVAVYANNNLPSNSKILLFGEVRGYYLNLPYIWGRSTIQSIIDYDSLNNEEMLYDKLKSLEITHLFINKNYLNDMDTKDSIKKMELLIKRHSREIYEHNGVYLYELT